LDRKNAGKCYFLDIFEGGNNVILAILSAWIVDVRRKASSINF
jgi:hypothetical protein